MTEDQAKPASGAREATQEARSRLLSLLLCERFGTPAPGPSPAVDECDQDSA